ncbi:hypothetical protein [Agromyces sp. ZXT2-6]|uniref:hypothetical protein n=1 Tax=Agromyces sp. ZXT2-6 TaxID=3461153 RepID=UPI004054EB25
MAGILIHDGRRSGHLGWAVNAISRHVADGTIISAFSTPRVPVPRNPSASDVAESVRAVGGEVIFDASTHSRLLPGSNRFDFYSTWELWGPDGVGLDTAGRRLQHVERTFAHQDRLRVPLLAPTLSLTSAVDRSAQDALETANLAAGLAKGAWQSLVGTRSFWRSGFQLDAYVGQLASLGSPVWVITLANEIVANHEPDLSDVEAISGLLRTIHSLAERSRVIVTHSDFAGLPAIAAGADTLGTGWDRGMRFFDPTTYIQNSENAIRIPASYVTQSALAAVLRRDTADAIERWDAESARVIRGGPLPPSEQAEREHHLRSLRTVLLSINNQTTRADRVSLLRGAYDAAGMHFDRLIDALGSFVKPHDKRVWRDDPYGALKHYAEAEGLW